MIVAKMVAVRFLEGGLEEQSANFYCGAWEICIQYR